VDDKADMHDDEGLVTIAVFDTLFEASLARGALEAAGIRALVPEESLVRRDVILQTARLQVLESDRNRSMVELQRRQIRLVQPPSDVD
jgi:hypothetical protein